jgi:hypothetical protein
MFFSGPLQSATMREDSWDRADGWWADLFGVEKALLWQGVSVRPHARLGDYGGVFVACRGAGCHLSLPAWFPAGLRESPSQQGASQLADARYWQQLEATSGLSVLGPSCTATPMRSRQRRTEPSGSAPRSSTSSDARSTTRTGTRAVSRTNRSRSSHYEKIRGRSWRPPTSLSSWVIRQHDLPRCPMADPTRLIGQRVAGFHVGRSASKATMSSSCDSVIPMSSRPSSSRQRV